jgi:serine/threonine-protein kinase
LQLVPDGTLRDAAPRLTRNELVRIMRAVAFGLHAAHAQGLIHRDVKPSNVLVHQTDTGEWLAYVTDFGLAMSVEELARTATGSAGTPLYMAPEQARGATERIDARTDVYGLGATLYHLLARRPLFVASDTAALLDKIQFEALPSLRSIDPSIPADLARIVDRATRKEPGERYATARELADNLQRFLDGEERAHKRVVGVGAAVVVVVLAAAALWNVVHVRRAARVREQVFDEMSQQANAIGTIARDAALLPLHDLGRETQQIRDRMREIERRMIAVGEPARGPGHYALGRGYVALERWSDAVRELEAARAAGEHRRELSYSLGLAYGRLYQQALATLAKTGDAAADSAQRDAIARAHREPALRHLTEASASTSSSDGDASTEYAQGLIALYEERFADALGLATRAAARAPSQFETHALAGDVHLTAAAVREWKGDFDGALVELEQAGVAYRAATELARSAAAPLEGECQRLIDTAYIQMLRGLPLEATAKLALAACDRARVARPDDAALAANEAQPWLLLAHYQSWHGIDPTPSTTEAIRLGRAALVLDPNAPEAHLGLAQIYGVIGEHELFKGRDPSAALDQVLAYGARAAVGGVIGFHAERAIASSLNYRCAYQAGHGIDVRPCALKMAEHAHKALAFAPQSFDASTSLGNSDGIVGVWQSHHGIDPTDALTRSMAQFDKINAANPQNAVGFINLALGAVALAEHRLRVGADPRAAIDRAIAGTEQALAVEPQHLFGHLALANAYEDRARWQSSAGGDVRADVDRARRELQAALAIDRRPDAYDQLGRVELLAAIAAIDHGRDPTRALAAAETAARQAVALSNSGDAQLLDNLAEILRRRAGWRWTQHRSDEPTVRAALALTGQALAINPDSDDVYATEGALALLAARSAGEGDARQAAAQRARTALGKAIAINSFQTRACQPSLTEAARLADGAASRSAVESSQSRNQAERSSTSKR